MSASGPTCQHDEVRDFVAMPAGRCRTDAATESPAPQLLMRKKTDQHAMHAIPGIKTAIVNSSLMEIVSHLKVSKVISLTWLLYAFYECIF